MSISIDQMRNYLKKLYRGAQKWVDKVNKMPDKQVYAIYMRMLESQHLMKS